jgi:hypothetical protein
MQELLVCPLWQGCVEANIGLLLSRTECMWLETCPFKSSIETGHILFSKSFLLQHCGVDILLTPPSGCPAGT